MIFGLNHFFNVGEQLIGVLRHPGGAEAWDMPVGKSVKLSVCLDLCSEDWMGLGCICLAYVDDAFFKVGISSYLIPGTWGLHSASESPLL